MKNLDEFIDNALKQTKEIPISQEWTDSIMRQISDIKNCDKLSEQFFKPKNFALLGFTDKIISAIKAQSSTFVFPKFAKYFGVFATAACLTLAVYINLESRFFVPTVSEADYAQMTEMLDEINSTYILIAQESIYDLY